MSSSYMAQYTRLTQDQAIITPFKAERKKKSTASQDDASDSDSDNDLDDDVGVLGGDGDHRSVPGRGMIVA